MSVLARIKRKVARTIAAVVPPPGPAPVSEAELTAAYRVLSGDGASPARVAALCREHARAGWSAQGVFLNLLIQPEVSENLNSAEIARAMYESRAVLPLPTAFGAVVYAYPCDRFVYGAIKRTGAWEPHVEAFLRRWCPPGSVAVDVGANCGYFSGLLCSLAGPTGAVHAFEPAPHLIAALERTRDANGFGHLHIHRAAAGEARAASVTFHIDLINGGGNQVATGAAGAPAPERFLVGECPVVTLDEELKGRARRVAVMKVDVEGYELSVFRGARDLVRRDRPAICFEFAPGYMASKGADPTELVQLLLDAGYEFAFHDRPAPAGLSAAALCALVSREYGWTEVFATPRPFSFSGRE
ncbi:MAG: FkbM family methyltransferase [Gemmata sp.]